MDTTQKTLPSSLTKTTTLIHYVSDLLDIEHEAGRKVSGLAEIEVRRARHGDINESWSQVKHHIRQIQDRVDALPFLPPQEIIAWAQNIKAMASVAFLEVDTTDVHSQADIVRVALCDGAGELIFDQIIRPLSPQAHISSDASTHNGLNDQDLIEAPSLKEAWLAIEIVVRGRYVISFNQEWDLKALNANAQHYGLTPLSIIGECLQRKCTAYYHREYYLDLPKVAERMGHPLTGQDAVTRLKAQAAIVDGMARGITDVSKPRETVEPQHQGRNDNINDNAPDDLEDHPF